MTFLLRYAIVQPFREWRPSFYEMMTDHLGFDMIYQKENVAKTNSLGTGPQCPLCTVLWLTDSRTHSEVPTFFIDEESSRGGKEEDELYELYFFFEAFLGP
jgi:hypothetical protein